MTSFISFGTYRALGMSCGGYFKILCIFLKRSFGEYCDYLVLAFDKRQETRLILEKRFENLLLNTLPNTTSRPGPTIKETTVLLSN